MCSSQGGRITNQIFGVKGLRFGVVRVQSVIVVETLNCICEINLFIPGLQQLIEKHVKTLRGRDDIVTYFKQVFHKANFACLYVKKKCVKIVRRLNGSRF